jgi:hypothetical protein
MKAPTFLFGVVLLATSFSAQDAPIPQELPLQLRQTSDAVRRRAEQPVLQPPTLRPYSGGLLNRLRGTNRQTLATPIGVTSGSVEDRIAALEAKVQALQKEVETQKAMIEQLRQQLLDQQKKK